MQEVNIGHYQDNLCPLGRAVTQVLLGLSAGSDILVCVVLCNVVPGLEHEAPQTGNVRREYLFLLYVLRSFCL